MHHLICGINFQVALSHPCTNRSSSLSSDSLSPLPSSVTPSPFRSGLKHVFSINLSHHKLPHSSIGLTSWTSFHMLIGFWFNFSTCIDVVRLTKLFVFWAHVNIVTIDLLRRRREELRDSGTVTPAGRESVRARLQLQQRTPTRIQLLANTTAV